MLHGEMEQFDLGSNFSSITYDLCNYLRLITQFPLNH